MLAARVGLGFHSNECLSPRCLNTVSVGCTGLLRALKSPAQLFLVWLWRKMTPSGALHSSFLGLAVPSSIPGQSPVSLKQTDDAAVPSLSPTVEHR